MPKFTRRRFTRSSRGRRRGQSTRRIALRALRSTDQERKFLDNSFSNILINDTLTAATIVPLNLIPQGVANFARVGIKASMQSCYLQLVIEKQDIDVTPNGYVRLMLVRDRQANGTLPTWGNILNLSGSGNPVTELMSANNLNNSKRFVTLFDKRMHFQSDFMEGRIVKAFVPLNFTTQWSGGGITIGDLRSDSLLLCLCGHITTGGNVPRVTGVVRVRFVG